MKFKFLEEIDSTNKYAKEHINDFEDLTVIYTSNQTAGRGRLERTWLNTGTNNIYASFILKPSKEIKELYSNLTQYLSLVLAETLEEYGIYAKIKWPNDLRVNKKKISGILAEAVVEHRCLSGIVLGVGVNLSSTQKDFENLDQAATSVLIETGIKIDKKVFLEKLSNNFCLRYNSFIEEGFLLIREDYKKRAEFLNMPITVRFFDKEISGTAVDITEKGALKIIDNNNTEHILLIGDIL